METIMTYAEIINKYNLTMTASQPIGRVKNDWACIEYQVQLKKGDKIVYNGDFSLGVGHVNWKINPDFLPFNTEETQLIYTRQSHPYVTFKNKQHEADVAAKLAKIQKVQPKIEDVLNSLLLDSEVYSRSFNEWCADFGYDNDSIEAEKVYKECQDISRQLYKTFSIEEIEEIKEAMQDY